MSELPAKLDERAHQLFKVLVECYIRDGQPVGSRTLSRGHGIALSPATIRNVMADLEELGLLVSPHTSAGRVPTVKGYRLFVDTMLNVQPLQGKAVEALKKQFDPDMDAKELIRSASNVLSNITRLAGVVMLPRREGFSMRQIEFLPLAKRRILVILVINEKEVQNHVIHADRDYTHAELQQTANYINMNFSGKRVDEIVASLKRDLNETCNELQSLLQLVIRMVDDVAVKNVEGEDFVVDGQTNLMEVEDLSDMDKLKQLFDVFNRKRDILHLMDKCNKTDSMRIFIGQESGYKALEGCSLVTSSYTVEGELLGVLGVIGPTRMAYESVIPVVDVTARLLSAALSVRNG